MVQKIPIKVNESKAVAPFEPHPVSQHAGSQILRVYGHVIAIAILLTLLVAVVSCLSPIRWDLKTWGALWPRSASRPIEGGSNLVVVTPTSEPKQRHLTEYGAQLLAFPNGRVLWIIPREAGHEGLSPPNYLIDASGNLFDRNPKMQWIPVDKEQQNQIESFARNATVLFPDEAMRPLLRSRWPWLTSDQLVRVENKRASFLARPAIRVTTMQIAKLFFPMLILVSVMVTLTSLADRASPGKMLLHAAIALPLWLVVHTYLVIFVGQITEHARWVSFILETALCLVLLGRVARRNGFLSPLEGIHQLVGLLHPWGVAIASVALFSFLAFSVLRLDFDGDVFTHWFPMAAHHHEAGVHDPRAMVSRYGISFESTYPPAFPVFLSTLMWTADLPRGPIDAIGHNGHGFILLYRLTLAMLHLSVLSAIVGLFWSTRRKPWDWLYALLPVLLVALLLPLFLGRPMASEVWFVPMVGCAVVLFAAGHCTSNHWYTRAALIFTAFGLIIKNDFMLLGPFAVLTWYLALHLPARIRQIRVLMTDMAVFVAALAPYLLWKWQVVALGVNTHFAFRPISISYLLNEWRQLPPLFQNALKHLLSSNLWILMFTLLPIALIVALSRRGARKSIVIPVGILGLTMGLPAIYLFSKLDQVWHMDTSLIRLMTIPAFSAIIYVCYLPLIIAQPRDPLARQSDQNSPGKVETSQEDPGHVGTQHTGH